MDHSFNAFIAICLLLTVTPGADTALILKSASQSGVRSAFSMSLGICVGLLIHAFFSAFGLSAIMLKSQIVFETIKICGAFYLIYLGIEPFKKVLEKKYFFHRVHQDQDFIDNNEDKLNTNVRNEFKIGMLTNLLNPKVVLFYLTFLPQFIASKDSVVMRSLTLASVHVAMSFIWLNFLGQIVGRFKGRLGNSNFLLGVEYLTGIVLLAIGLKLLLTW